MTAIDPTALARLTTDFFDDPIRPSDASYDDTRKIWNGHIDRRPALIARCRGVADVIAAVRFAREHDLPASVRGGGHAVAGYAVIDDGLLIDQSKMTASRLDRLAQTIRARAGASTPTSTGRPRHSASRPRAAS